MKDILIGVDFVSLTSDGWTKKNLKGLYYNTITCHFIGSDFRLRHFLLDISDIDDRHTSERLLEKWVSILSKWDIGKEKIFSMTVDGGSNYSKASKEITKYPIWCLMGENRFSS